MNIDGIEIPIKVHFERRQSSRAAIGKQAINLRLPATIRKKELDERLQWMINWLKDLAKKKPEVLTRFQSKAYQSGDTLIVGGRSYALHITYSDKSTHSAKLKDGTISLSMCKGIEGKELEGSIKTLLSRVVGHDFLPEITKRVHDLNEIHFKKQIKAVKLRYTHSRWGSCSSSGNINLSTRLLFAPAEVIDYVIIHELAHRVEQNHSPRFWALVERAMPDYKIHELWLKKHGPNCDF